MGKNGIEVISTQHTAFWYFQHIRASTGYTYKSVLVATHTKQRLQMHQSQSELVCLLSFFLEKLTLFSLSKQGVFKLDLAEV